MGIDRHGSAATGATPPATPDARCLARSVVLARNWWVVALRGVCAMLFGALAFLAPGATLLTLVLFFAAYMLVDGAFAIAAAIRAAQREERWGMLLLEGLLDIAIGVAAFLLPGAAVWAFVYLVAFWALVSGGLMLAAAFALHRSYGRWWLALGGVVSLLLGVALLVNPNISALVLTWWLAGYAVAFGVSLIVLAFSLRGRHGETIRAPAAAPPVPTDAPGRSA